MLIPRLACLFALTCLSAPTALAAQTPSPTGPVPTSSSKSRAAAPGGERMAVPVQGGRPINVLLILVDQLNARMLGHEDNGYGGVTQSLTPNLDQLAAEGVRFSNAACASAICQASRYSILTGRWPHNHGVRTNSIWEPLTETTFPELARGARYRTASIGKNHLIWANQLPPWQVDHGFDELLDEGDYGQFCNANGVPRYETPGNFWAMPGLPTTGDFDRTGFTMSPNQFHPAGYWTDEVIRFLEDRAGPGGDGKPFACWYSMIGPHPPILPSGVAPDDWAHRYQPYSALTLPPSLNKLATTQRLAVTQGNFAALTDDQMREALSYYYGLISQIDWNIGRVLQKLDELGLAEDTLVIFTADHGEMASEMHCWTKGAGSYDALTRVPLIARLPGLTPPGTTVTAPANNVDIFPTLVEATGVPITQAQRAAVDGVSLLSLMADPTLPAGWQQATFHELGTSLGPPGRHFMVRTPTAKLAMDELDSSEEFYDLALDPFEINDLIASPAPAVQAEISNLRALFALWWNDEIGHAPHYLPIGGAPNTLPIAPTAPVPADGAGGVKRAVDPSWLPCTGAAFQDVFFGTDPTSLPLFQTVEHMRGSFNPGTLDANSTYYWRVDQINANGTATGNTWSFTTEDRGQSAPGLPSAPTPAHTASGVLLGSSLSWNVGASTQHQDLYFGLAGQLQLAVSGLPANTTNWQPPPLSAGLTYEWRVDEGSPGALTAGDVWSFEVSPAGLPKRAVAISPAHLQQGVSAGAALIWLPGKQASSHDVYFGSSFPLPLRTNQKQTWWNPGSLVPGTTYYWRIDEVNAAGTRIGLTSRFTR